MDGTDTTSTTNISGGAGSASGESGDEPDHPPQVGFRRVLEAQPAALSLLRRGFRRWLREMRWPDGDVADLVMALNEAAANVVDHAYRAGTGEPAGDVRVLAELVHGPASGRQVRVMVADSGRWQPISTDPGYRGRGLPLMRACSAWLGVDPGPNGTCVTMVSRPCLAL